jgi:hypothetical protein
VGTGLALAAVRPAALVAQAPTPRPLATGTVRGTLLDVDKSLSGLIVRNEAGENVAWRLDRSVIAEVAKFKRGDRLYVIYRELGGRAGRGDRAVTAVGFPGSEPKPLYVNATGATVRLRTGPLVDGECRGLRESSQVGNFRLPRGSTTEDEAACWCCSSMDQTCEPANRAYEPGTTVTGRIILSRCFP